jgi:anthranilate synthase component 1
MGDHTVVSASPEILARVEDGKITVRPLAGTRRRGKTEQEDIALEKELLADSKELAEHLMLIDLSRNDSGRVSKIGSVEVTRKMFVERYSHVMHIASIVESEIRDDKTALDVLKSTLPVGTLSGAPKVRAMQIIDELEPVKRGVYGGAMGYLGWNNSMDMAIAIRTALVKDGQLHVQAGAGIVADSDPDSEWEETLTKAKALIKALQMAQNKLLIE